ncbi:hypothetical protein HBI56_181850 [Parastagonospora nodorum]|uniref:Protein FAF1 n=2 Tax=Phaeosphaeria nodorum (strain SN15 / ATCC MYA-4574 / FGSC 10173) TaxID=321614 RepID=A0A7U2I425_PHANO|nr:hypothetical protein SNOG_16443 [Parastagonospora nodorum SN15]KAH3907742.1 hypothetical protein HBH56_187260 [Parastagonospora nodorum]EAT76141.1 hypothetical protein SNOG_16443 [Parastagonospora nodorum SN15]KAH3925298.1 hypothetical protein HBH54_181300 [Parastagonospora nodorum]KAH3952856.1 hypothetical protein HBH53_034690 [Parastagonospora nodorum]KAH3959155.1 hypothetical protein HBH52_245780 [Parastagonospora nodorum]
MAPALGKRKRISRKELEQPSRSPSPSPSSDSNESGEEDVQAIFRRAFEAKFKPLAVETKEAKIETPKEIAEEEADGEEDAEWAGISEGDDDVQIIDYTNTQLGRDDTSKAEMKAFMSSKPPTSTAAPKKSLTVKKSPDEADLAESNNLRNDLDLQKLLRESHLLSTSSSGTSTPTLSATGIARHKSTDLHLQSLGAKRSVFSQKKMPMAQRKHMIQKARLTDEKRRAEAKEAGIILERPTMNKIPGKRDETRKRDKAVGLPSVGKFRGGTLSLSKKDVRSITGGGGGGAKGKGKGKKAKR